MRAPEEAEAARPEAKAAGFCRGGARAADGTGARARKTHAAAAAMVETSEASA